MLYTWRPPPPPPPQAYVAGAAAFRIVLPLLLLLPLFLVRANRAAAAWWVWLPVGVTTLAGITMVALCVDGDVSLQRTVCAVVTGLGAIWLLAPWLQGRCGIARFFKTLLVLAAFSLLAFGLTTLAGNSGYIIAFWPYMAIALGCACLATTLVFTFTGLCARRRFGRVRFLLWLALWILLVWTVIITTMFIITAGSNEEWGQVVIGVLITSGLWMVLLSPFVLLSFFQPFYQARFFAWLNRPQPEPPIGTGIPPPIEEPAPASMN